MTKKLLGVLRDFSFLNTQGTKTLNANCSHSSGLSFFSNFQHIFIQNQYTKGTLNDLLISAEKIAFRFFTVKVNPPALEVASSLISPGVKGALLQGVNLKGKF